MQIRAWLWDLSRRDFPLPQQGREAVLQCLAALLGCSWQSRFWDTLSLGALPPQGLSAWLFQPCLLDRSPSGPSAWTPHSALLRQLGGSSASPFPAAALEETQQRLQESQTGSRTLLWQVPNGATPSAWQSHNPLTPTCCHRTPHRHKTHPTRPGNIRAPLLPHGLRLPLRGTSLSQAGEQHLQPLVSCLLQLSLALAGATAGKQAGRDSVLACR